LPGTPNLLQYFQQTTPPHAIAVRVYQGDYLVQKAKTISGKEFTLLNLPFYLVHRIERELDKIEQKEAFNVANP
jgi:hypothetical protein